jgi:hypothetical protein
MRIFCLFGNNEFYVRITVPMYGSELLMMGRKAARNM